MHICVWTLHLEIYNSAPRPTLSIVGCREICIESASAREGYTRGGLWRRYEYPVSRMLYKVVVTIHPASRSLGKVSVEWGRVWNQQLAEEHLQLQIQIFSEE